MSAEQQTQEVKPLGRFDNIPFNEDTAHNAAMFKKEVERLEAVITRVLQNPRYKALAITELEKVAMWFNKGLRDDQYHYEQQIRNGTGLTKGDA